LKRAEQDEPSLDGSTVHGIATVPAGMHGLELGTTPC
jgi:hypothetical protein